MCEKLCLTFDIIVMECIIMCMHMIIIYYACVSFYCACVLPESVYK